MIANNMQRQTTWLAPRPVRWFTWLAVYTLAITLNRKYADFIIIWLGLEVSTHWQHWLISILPAVVVVTILLLIRCIWYQLWLIYQRNNEYVYHEKVLNNQKYWSEYMFLEEVIFRCGQLNHVSDFYDYLDQVVEDRKKSVFESMSMELTTLTNASVYTDRLHFVLSQLVQTLSSRKFFTEQYSHYLWLWSADKESWLIFRELVIAEGGNCPVVPDYYVKFEDLNWVIDRCQEEIYHKILLLGFECQPEFELYLGMIFANKGKMAKIQRAFDMHKWRMDEDYFFAAISEQVSGFQVENNKLQSVTELKEMTDMLFNRDYEIQSYQLEQPEFLHKLQHTGDWMQLLLAIYQVNKHSYMVLFQYHDKIIPVSQVK